MIRKKCCYKADGMTQKRLFIFAFVTVSFVLAPFALHKLCKMVTVMPIGKVFQELTVLSIALL